MSGSRSRSGSGEGRPPGPAELDSDALEVFAAKGLELGRGAAQVGEANAAKVRRILTITRDLAGDLGGLRILDLGCAEGVYAIEAAAHGAEVTAIDGRTERMQLGIEIAGRHGLDRVSFEQRDARDLRSEEDGSFDVVWCLGLLYHLDAPELSALLDDLARIARRAVVIDTVVATSPGERWSHRGLELGGERVREHPDDAGPDERRANVFRSLDSTFSFRPTERSLIEAFGASGFGSVMRCESPLEPGKAPERITLAAVPSRAVELATYPWINGLGENEIASRLESQSE